VQKNPLALPKIHSFPSLQHPVLLRPGHSQQRWDADGLLPVSSSKSIHTQSSKVSKAASEQCTNGGYGAHVRLSVKSIGGSFVLRRHFAAKKPFRSSLMHSSSFSRTCFVSRSFFLALDTHSGIYKRMGCQTTWLIFKSSQKMTFLSTRSFGRLMTVW